MQPRKMVDMWKKTLVMMMTGKEECSSGPASSWRKLGLRRMHLRHFKIRSLSLLKETS